MRTGSCRRRSADGATSSADGVGTSSSVSRTTSSPDRRCTHSSGFSSESVREGRHGDRLDVVGGHEVAAGERGAAARELEQREAAARARADGEARATRASPRRERRCSARRTGSTWTSSTAACIASSVSRSITCVSRRSSPRRSIRRASISHSASARRVAEPGAQQEPVELCLGQRVRALVLDRVLRREDEERPLERPRHPVRRHLPLLHRLEQRGLGLRRRAVDLVGEQQVREDRARPELEVAVALVPDRRAGDVRGQQVGRELDAAEAEPARLGKGARGQRLRQPGHVLEQDVAVGQEAEQDRARAARACRRPRARPRRSRRSPSSASSRSSIRRAPAPSRRGRGSPRRCRRRDALRAAADPAGRSPRRRRRARRVRARDRARGRSRAGPRAARPRARVIVGRSR